MLPRAMALHDTGDDNTATVAPELTSQIAQNGTICTPTLRTHETAATRARFGVLRTVGRGTLSHAVTCVGWGPARK